MATTLEEEKKYTPTSEETVAGTLGGLLSSGSSYLEAAKTRGIQTAAQRGLLNTSMAAGASEAAAIEAALPIAEQDAGYMQSRGLATQEGEIQTGLYKTQGDISSELLTQEGEQTRALSTQEAGQASALSTQQAGQTSALSTQETAQTSALLAQESEQNITLENIQQDGENYRAGLEYAMNLELSKLNLTSQEKTAVGAAVAEMGTYFSDQLAYIQSDPDMTAADKTTTIRQLQAAYQSNLSMVASIYGVSITWKPVV